MLFIKQNEKIKYYVIVIGINREVTDYLAHTNIWDPNPYPFVEHEFSIFVYCPRFNLSHGKRIKLFFVLCSFRSVDFNVERRYT